MTKENFKFIDSHVHFYDMNHPTLHYGHWQPDEDLPLKELGNKNYLPTDYIKDAKPLGMKKVIHVQAAIGSKDPVDETKWLQNIYTSNKIPHAIVGHVDLRSPNARSVIERHLEYPNFKGIRDFSYGDYLTSSAFRKGFHLLDEYNLISNIAVEWPEIDKLKNLAKSYPNIIIVLDHAGIPRKRDEEYFQNWKSGLKTISEMENVICKISGLAMGDHNWTIESIKPYVETCIEIFGSTRIIFGTNWPVDGLWSEYSKVINAYKKITGQLSKSEREAFFFKNAEFLYKI
tara:strand:+ start:5196 stop:6059 length:864 start_codon:yes stop_codon:yes gene_type:complete